MSSQSPVSPGEVTQLLRAQAEGGEAALNHVVSLLYEELKTLARKFISLTKPAQVLNRHTSREVCAVTIPIEKVKRGRRLAHHIALDRWPIDLII